MKATKRIAGALTPFVIGVGLLASCGSTPEESTEPVEDGQAVEEAADAASESAPMAEDAAADEVTEEVPVEDEAVEEEPIVEDVAEAEANRFAPGAGMADGDLGRYYTTMEIAIDGESVGTMTFELWPDDAPITVRNHLRLVDEGFYDGITFHRVMRDFMVQGGDPTGTGTGGSPYGTIQAEFSREQDRSHEYGVLSMARTPAPNSASSQFFIICDNQNGRQLNGQYASFGRLTSGVETLERIANVPVGRSPRGEASVPQARVEIVDAEVVEGDPAGGEEITRPE